MNQYKQQNMQSLKNAASNTQNHICAYNTIKLNAAFCCTTVQDVDVLTQWFKKWGPETPKGSLRGFQGVPSKKGNCYFLTIISFISNTMTECMTILVHTLSVKNI